MVAPPPPMLNVIFVGNFPQPPLNHSREKEWPPLKIIIAHPLGKLWMLPILFIYIPVLLLVIFYSSILIKLRTQAHPGEQSSNIEQQRQRRNRNVLCMSIAIISLFVFCWLSFMTNILILSYRGSSIHFSCNFRQYYVVNSMVAPAIKLCFQPDYLLHI